MVAVLLSAFAARAATTNVTLAWNANTETNLAGYRLHYGTASGVYSASKLVGAGVLSTTASNLTTGQTYYFAVKATNTAGLESPFSTEVAYLIPGVNTAPVASAQTVTTPEDAAKAITLSGTDADGNALSFSIVSSANFGTLSGALPNITYTPPANFNGTDSFVFKANDGTVDSATATVTISVTAVNDAPVASAQSVTTAEDTAKAITVSGSDIDGNALTYSVVTAPTKGTLSGTAPNFTYTPAANTNGTDSFTFRANDGVANSANATVTLSITAANDAPVALAQNVTATEDTAKAITLGATDVDGNALTYTVVASPAQGTLSGTGANRTYTPTANYSGPDSFTFKANDGTVDSATVTVSITVAAGNDAPVAVAQSVNATEDTAKPITLAGTDLDGNALTFAVVASPTKGTLSGTAPNLTYTPTANLNGTDSFTFRANDGTTNSATATVSISIAAVNDAPVANAQSTSTPEETAKSITLAGSDVDADALTFAVVAGPANGTLSGTAPNFTYTPTANFNGADSFTFKANDGTVDSPVATVSISVTAVNDAPVASAQSVSTAEDSAKAITLAGVDQDGNTLTFAVVGAPTKGTLSGTAPNLTYTPTANLNGSDSFTFKANDGTVDSPVATVSITITAVNDAPVAAAQSVGTDRNVAKSVTLSGTDVDVDSLTFTVVSQPTRGTLSGTAPNLTYTPNNNVTGADSFTFKANDGTVDSATATVSINIATGPNTAPVANAQSVTATEDLAKSITLTGSDLDGDTLTFSVTTAPAHGTLSGTAPNLTYTPTANYTGSDSIWFRANDGISNSALAVVSITVSAVNDAPTAVAQSVSTIEDTAKNITLAGSDVDGNALTFSIVAGPAHGALSGSQPNIIYTPAANYNGADSFTFKANDGTVDSATVTVAINVTAVNDPPVTVPQNLAATEDIAKPITLSATDTDLNTLTYTVVTPPAHGALTGTAPNLSYKPVADYFGSDSFTFKANDGTMDSPVTTVSIAVAAVNDAPVAAAQSVGTDRNVAKPVTLSGTDVDADPLTFSVVSQPTRGTLSGIAPNLTYTPNNNVTGADSFTFKANDGSVDSAPATLSINIATGPNTPPVATAQDVAVTEDTAQGITLAGTDGDGDVLTFSVTTAPAHGTLSGTAPNLTYTPTANYSGSDSLWFRANDGTTNSALTVVSITVSAVNDAPVAVAQSLSAVEDTAKNLTLTGTDVDADALTFAVVASPAHGTLSGAGANLTYTPTANYSGPDSFTFKANDGTVDSPIATVALNVTAGNDLPTANSQVVLAMEDTAKAITVSGSDPENDVLVFSVVAAPTHGTISGSGANLTYTPTANYSGADSFTFKANDGTGDSTPATVTIDVTAVNDAPVASAQSIGTDRNVAKPVTLAGTDADNDTLTFNIVAQPTQGTLSGSAPNLTYTPNNNVTGNDSFSFKANDGTVDSATAIVSITIASGPNSAPVATAQDIAATEDTAKAITLAGTDGDGDALTFIVTTAPMHGTISGVAPNLTYTPTANYSGSDSLWFRANDGKTNSAVSVVSITVAAANDAPVAAAQSVATASGTAKIITLGGSDVDGNAISFAVVSGPANGTLSGVAPNLTYTPGTGFSGSDSFTFKANDGTVDSAPATVSINVTAPTASPITLDPIADVTTDENSAGSTVALTGISTTSSTGRTPKRNRPTLSVTANSSDTSLVPTPTVSYSNPNSTGSLNVKPAANASGVAVVTVTVTDGLNTPVVRSFKVVVRAVNSPPTLNALAAMTIADTAGVQTVALTGISAGLNETQPLTVTARSSNPGVVPNPTVNYASPQANGSLAFTPVTGASGSAIITVTVNDGDAQNNLATRSFTVTVYNGDMPPVVTLTSPTFAQVFSSGSIAKLAASVAANGHTISKVQFFVDATLVGESAAAPYTADWKCEGYGDHNLTARAVYESNLTVDSELVKIVVAALPAPWETAEIGTSITPGNANASNDVFTVEGAGNVSGSSDNFRFVYQPLSADGEIKVKLASTESTGREGRIGVMIRENLTSASKNVFVGISPDGVVRWQTRNSSGGSTSVTSSAGGLPEIWIRLVRTGSTIKGYKSTDGVQWSSVGSATISMAANIYVGFAVSSGTTTVLNTSTFVTPNVVP